MKISVLLASPDALDYNLIDVMRVLNTTFDELGEKLNFIKLDQRTIPPLSSQYPVNDVANIVNQLSNSDGVIFACTSNLFAPCSIMQNFLDYLSLPMYSNFLKDKNCFTIVVSNEYGEMEAAQYLTSVIQHFGGFSPVVTSINRHLSSQFKTNKDVSEIFEKQVEDYYRVLRQNRKFFNSSIQIAESMVANQNFDNLGYSNQPPQQTIQQTLQQPMAQAPQITPTPVPSQPQNIQQNAHVPNFGQNEYMNNSEHYSQETYTGVPNFDASQHIQEKLGVSQASSLTNPSYIPEPLQPQQHNGLDFGTLENHQDNSFLDNNIDFTQSTGSTTIPSNSDVTPQQLLSANPQQFETLSTNPQSQNVNTPSAPQYNETYQEQAGFNDISGLDTYAHQGKSLKQSTLDLEKNFIPHQSNGLVTEIQFKISGNENFDVYIQINGTDCRCHEGVSPSADLTVISTDDVWQEVLQGHITTQKAFMTGQLKVRGNFVLLPRFDALFTH